MPRPAPQQMRKSQHCSTSWLASVINPCVFFLRASLPSGLETPSPVPTLTAPPKTCRRVSRKSLRESPQQSPRCVDSFLIL